MFGVVQVWEATRKPRTGADDEKGSEELSVLEEDPPEKGWKESSREENWAWECMHFNAPKNCLRISKEVLASRF